jgi:hypothetical protein
MAQIEKGSTQAQAETSSTPTRPVTVLPVGVDAKAFAQSLSPDKPVPAGTRLPERKIEVLPPGLDADAFLSARKHEVD